MKRSELRPDPEKVRAFVQRGRESSARSLAGRRAISPASFDQRRKVRPLACLNCGAERGERVTVDAAHVIPRSLGGCDSADCVVPLCRRADGSGCHREYDEGRLELLPLLTWSEQAHAVSHVGIAAALRQTTKGSDDG